MESQTKYIRKGYTLLSVEIDDPDDLHGWKCWIRLKGFRNYRMSNREVNGWCVWSVDYCDHCGAKRTTTATDTKALSKKETK